MSRPPLIDRTVILEASLALADERGLDAITMQAVAERLGVTPMALYRHVSNKADLLDGMVESLLDEIPPPRPGGGWQAQLIAMAQSLRRIAKRHPAVFPLLLLRPAVTDRARALRERVYDGLRAARIAPAHLVDVERIISTLAFGFATGEAAGRFPKRRAATFRAMTTFVVAGLAPFVAG